MSTIYAKIVSSDNGFRIETKEAEFIDEWPTLIGVDYPDHEAAKHEVKRHKWLLVSSWQEALRLEGISHSRTKRLTA